MALIVITGGPGAGKTTLLQALEQRGHTIVGDAPRSIIQDRRRRGLSPRPEPHVFAMETLRIDVDNYERHAMDRGHVFFERGVVDALCSVDHASPLGEDELATYLAKYRYFSTVFVLPPWRAIYVTDAERDHTFEHAERVNEITQAWYRRCGYDVLEVPTMSVDERCAFVLGALASGEAAKPPSRERRR